MQTDWKVIAGFAAAAVVSTTAAVAVISIRMDQRSSSKRPQKWLKVGHVKEFLIYPVKSCKGIHVEEATPTPIGFKVSEYCRDRIFMVVNPEGLLVRQSDEPKMALIGVSVESSKLTLTAPNMTALTIDFPEDRPELRRSCTIWGEVVKDAVDCGAEVSRWLKDYLGRDLFLYYHFRTTSCRPGLTKDHQRFSTFSVNDKGSFQDDTSYMFVTQESLDELNKHLQSPVDALRFRPNIVIEGTPEPFSEDHWGYVRIGEEDGPVFKVAQPCLRCRLTLVDQETGTVDRTGDPLKTLHKLKHTLWNDELRKVCKGKAIFGTQLGLFDQGTTNAKKGDAVYVALL